MFFAGGAKPPQTPRFFIRIGRSVGSVDRSIGRSVGRPDRYFQKFPKNRILGCFWQKNPIKSHFWGIFDQKCL